MKINYPTHVSNTCTSFLFNIAHTFPVIVNSWAKSCDVNYAKHRPPKLTPVNYYKALPLSLSAIRLGNLPNVMWSCYIVVFML